MGYYGPVQQCFDNTYREMILFHLYPDKPWVEDPHLRKERPTCPLCEYGDIRGLRH